MALLAISGCHVKIVDVAQPIASATKFYADLTNRNPQAAMSHFTSDFVSQSPDWPMLLDGLQKKYGPVVTAKLESYSLSAMVSDPCYSLTYTVKRESLVSTEILFLCSKASHGPWLIRGHELTRQDTGQVIASGELPSEVGVHIP